MDAREGGSEWMQGREGGKEGGREEGWKGGREGGREDGREGGVIALTLYPLTC